MIPEWYLVFVIVTSFLMGAVAYRMSQLLVRELLKPRPRYRRSSR